MEESIEASAFAETMAGRPPQPQPPVSVTRRVTSSLQFHSMTLAEKLKYAAWGGGLSAGVFELFGAGAAGMGLALLVAFGSGYWSEELQQGLIKKLPLPRENPAVRQGKLHWWLTGEQLAPTATVLPAADPEAGETGNAVAESDEVDMDSVFLLESEPEDNMILRLMPNDIIRNTEPDCYRICIGRSLTKPGNPAVWINFYGQHLKLIGASQYGKSSMAAAILYLITRTHAPESVLIALLDMEHKTSKLFADIPHLAQVNVDGSWISLHAKTREQVLEHLNHIVAIMNERYSLSEEEVEEEPILLVYLEEFLALKDYFKRMVDSLAGSAKEQAKKDYSELVFAVSEIARRGLKVKVQLLMCAQVDYRDEDFQEALINITGGMSFCVRVSAAQAAGFVRADLLKRNVEADKKGQCVIETPDCKDLVLAVEYDLKKKLLDFEKARKLETGNRRPESGKRPSMVTSAARQRAGGPGPAAWTNGQGAEHPAPETVTEAPDARQAPIIPIRKPKTLDERAIDAWNAGHTSGRKLAAVLEISESAGNQLMNRLAAKGLIQVKRKRDI